jgi:hypothetical protein
MFFFLLQCRRIPPPAPTDGAPKNTASRVTDHTASVIHHVQGRSIIHRSSIGSRPAARPRVQGSRRDATRRGATCRHSPRLVQVHVPGRQGHWAACVRSAEEVSFCQCPHASDVLPHHKLTARSARDATPRPLVKKWQSPTPPFCGDCGVFVLCPDLTAAHSLID